MEVTMDASGSFEKTVRHLVRMSHFSPGARLRALAEKGKQALAAATPVDSGATAASWGYSISENGGVYTIEWTNSNVQNGAPVAILLQYGHGTGNGGYVQGRDYINPAMKPIFDEIEKEMWRIIRG